MSTVIYEMHVRYFAVQAAAWAEKHLSMPIKTIDLKSVKVAKGFICCVGKTNVEQDTTVNLKVPFDAVNIILSDFSSMMYGFEPEPVSAHDAKRSSDYLIFRALPKETDVVFDEHALIEWGGE